MLSSIAPGDSVHLGSVRCRGGRDALRERRCFEAAMRDVSGASVGLPASALLFVRRVAPSAPLRGSAGTDRFADAVRTELTRTLRGARRPWLQGDAASADAVLFLDDAELAACLIRDWLQGRVAERWWWKNVLGTSTVCEWLRRQVIARGEMLAAVTETLSASGHVLAWYARIENAHLVQAQAALDAAYGVAATAASVASVPAAGPAAGSVPARGADAAPADVEAAALQTLLEVAAEVASNALSVERRRLLATALVVRRRLQWARSPAFTAALRAMSERQVNVPEPVVGPAPPLLNAAPRVATRPTEFSRADAIPSRTLTKRHWNGRTRAQQVGSQPAPASSASVSTQVQSTWPAESRREQSTVAPNQESDAAPSPQPAMLTSQRVATDARIAASPVEPALDPVAARSTHAAAAHAPTRDVVEELLSQGVHTNFGGIFYLLNVALSLGLYGDFTAPRMRGIELSPWDWLAAIGRRWFGDEFRKDRTWNVLAELAGHPPRRRPERGFKPPKNGETPFSGRTADRWFAALSAYLVARLMQALGSQDAPHVPDQVCRHRALINVSASTVDVHLSLADLPISLRIAGLDRDPGWIPAAGRSLRFHFQ